MKHSTVLQFAPGAALLAVALLVPPSRAAAPAAPPICDSASATIVGTPGNDSIQGTPRDDVIAGLGGHDVIHGARGNDVICGGPGADRIFGEEGGDDLFGDGGTDVVRGGPSLDWLNGAQGRDHLFGGARRDVILAAGHGLVHGGSGNDLIRGFREHSRVYGDAGRDYLVGWLRIGSDQVIDGGPDVNGLELDLRQQPGSPEVPWNEATINLAHGMVTTDGQRAKIFGSFHGIRVGSPRSALHWTLIGTKEPDALSILAVPPRPVAEYGRGGDDHLAGGNGDDLLDGGSGYDRAYAAEGVDTCISIEAPLYTDTGCDTTERR